MFLLFNVLLDFCFFVILLFYCFLSCLKVCSFFRFLDFVLFGSFCLVVMFHSVVFWVAGFWPTKPTKKAAPNSFDFLCQIAGTNNVWFKWVPDLLRDFRHGLILQNRTDQVWTFRNPAGALSTERLRGPELPPAQRSDWRPSGRNQSKPWSHILRRDIQLGGSQLPFRSF